MFWRKLRHKGNSSQTSEAVTIFLPHYEKRETNKLPSLKICRKRETQTNCHHWKYVESENDEYKRSVTAFWHGMERCQHMNYYMRLEIVRFEGAYWSTSISISKVYNDDEIKSQDNCVMTSRRLKVWCQAESAKLVGRAAQNQTEQRLLKDRYTHASTSAWWWWLTFQLLKGRINLKNYYLQK